jgi:steroid delta-isomerase-like uncharacterized protein
MTAREMVKLAQENIDAFNAGDWQRAKATLAPNAVYDEVGTQRRIQGVDQIIETFQGWKQAMPDAKGTITKAVAGDGGATLEITWSGTHTGPLMGPGGTIPASGKRQETRAAMVLTFEGERIKEAHQYFDMMTMLHQIGAAS